MSRAGLSELPEINTLILLDLPYEDLMSACLASKEIYQVCQDQNFWRQKIIRDFGLDVIPYKPQKETFFQQYRHLVTVRDPYEEIKGGNIDGLIVLARNGYRFTTKDADNAVDFGQLAILNWLNQQGILPNPLFSSITAAKHGDFDIVKWLDQHGIHPDVYTANWAAVNRHQNIVDWLAERGIHPNRQWVHAVRSR